MESWVGYLASKTREGESLYETSERLLTTHAYLECRGKPLHGRESYRKKMAVMLKMNGAHGSGKSDVAIHRKIHKYDLEDLVLR
jgi:hypothetical protein